MESPVSGSITISQAVSEYRGEKVERLCLQKIATDASGGAIWEVQFVKPEEANAPSWYDAHHGFRGALTRVQEIFSRHHPIDRVLLDVKIRVHEAESGITQLRYDSICNNTSIINQSYNIQRNDNTRNIFQLIFSYDYQAHICTPEAHQALENQWEQAIRAEERSIQGARATEPRSVVEREREEQVYAPVDRVEERPVQEAGATEPRSVVERAREEPVYIPREDLRPKLRIRVEREMVTKDPVSILHKVHKEIEERETYLPKFVALGTRYEGEAGADAGGVSAELISDLIQVLTDPKSKVNFKGFEFVEGGIPSLTSDEGKVALTSLGVLLGFCVTNEKFRIGPTFDERFYNLMSHLPPPPIDTNDPKLLREAYIALNSEDKLVEYLHKPVDDLDEAEIQHVLYSAWTDGEFPEGVEEDPKAHWGAILQQVDKVIIEEIAPTNSKVQAAFLIGDGMEKVCDWGEVSSKSPEDLRTSIEGEFSKDLLIERLEIKDKETEKWMLEWVNQASEEDLVLFVKTITGSRTLGTRRLTFDMIEAEPQDPPAEGEKPEPLPLPVFHTCFYSVDVPKYANQEEFTRNLDISLKWAGGFGNA